MAGWAAAAQAAMQVGAEWMNSSAQHNANRTNIRLQRDNQRWQEGMSNTAIQRRADDIEAAGGNRALAFTNGSEATTPSIQSARIDPPSYRAPQLNTAMLMKAQLDNLKAQTVNTSADTRGKTIANDIAEGMAQGGSIKYDLLNKEASNREIESRIKTNLERADLTARQTQLLDRTIESLATEAANQARKGTLDLKALENIAQYGGIEANQMGGLLKMLTSIILQIMKD